MADQKWNLVIDVDRCNGCYNCVLAAKDEYVDNSAAGYFAPMPRHGHAWVDVHRHERGEFPAVDVAYLPVMCNHCDDAPCVKASKGGAVSKRGDGIVVIHPEKAKGQTDIVAACPYGAVFWNEQLDIPQHWPFDAHLIDKGWSGPRCVEVCATQAITAIKATDEEMGRIAREQALSVRGSNTEAKPRIYYKGVQRISHAFIAGSVVARVGDSSWDCVEGCLVELASIRGAKRSLTTDAFGDFRFDGLELGSGPYVVTVKFGQTLTKIDVETLTTSKFIGSIEVR